MENKKIAIIGGHISSGGLTAITRMILQSNAIPQNFTVRYYCSKELYEKVGAVNERIDVVLSDGFYRKTLKEKITRSYGSEFVAQLKEWNPDLVLFMGEVIPRDFRGMKTVFNLKNQFSFDYGQILKNGFNKLSVVLFYVSRFARRTVKYAYASVYDTEYSRQGVKNCGYALEHSKVIYMNVNKMFYSQINHKVHNASEPWKLLYVSSVAPYKHQLEVIKCIKPLKDAGYNVHLSVVGKQIHSGYIKKCKDYVNKYGLTGEIEFTDWVEYDKMPEIIDSADIIINASTLDTTGLPVAEAMARGAVIVASNAGFNRETLGDGGLYFDVKDVGSIVEAVKQVLDSEKLRSKMSKRAKELADEYAKTDTASEYYKFIEELLGE